MVCKYVVEYCRYADTLNYSFQTLAEFQAAKSELLEKFDLFSLPLKYCVTGWKYDKEVFSDPKRGESQVEKMLGIQWNLKTIFSDGGSNLLAKNLGASKEYFSEKIGKLISTKNNPGYSQYKHCCERYVKILKQ